MGLNNSWKGDVLDAVESIGSRKYTEDDFPDFLIEPVTSSMKFSISNGRYNACKKFEVIDDVDEGESIRQFVERMYLDENIFDKDVE